MVGLGWAQPLTSIFGSLPPRALGFTPRRSAARYLTAVLLAAASACGANVTPEPRSPSAARRTDSSSAVSSLSAQGTSAAAEQTVVSAQGTPPSVQNSSVTAQDAATPPSTGATDKGGLAVAPGPPSAASATPAAGAAGGQPNVSPLAPGAPSPSGAAAAPVAPSDPVLARLLALGDGALAREDYAAAVESFRKARRHAPKEARAVVGLVAARFGQLGIPTEYKGAPASREIKELLTLLDEAAIEQPDLGSVYLQRGRLLVVLGQGASARTSLLKARASLPNDAEVHSLLAIVDLSEGHVPEALAGFATAAERDPNNPDRLANWGTALLLHGDIQQAISVFRRAVSLAPNDARARGNLGTALLATSDAGQALPHLQRACELAPTKATFMSNLGYAHQQLGDSSSAKIWYDKALAADPKLGSAWINLGLWHAAQGKYDAAEQAFKKALALDPHDPRALANLEDLKQVRAAR